MELYNNKNDCCGCEACKNICPKKAIKIIRDKRGFLYPKIESSKCIECGMCKKICPLKVNINKPSKSVVYALKNKNDITRKTSSSGGVFSELANYIIKNEGYVFGAIYDENLNVCHIGTNKIGEVSKFKTSKYVQSNLKNTYLEVKELLKESKLVLFCGTPCQVFGLKKFLKKEHDNLITCDNICHGVPSPKIFEEYKQLMEEKFKSKIVYINFRHKENWQTQVMKIVFRNGREYYGKCNMDMYYRLFLSNIILRESCYTCHFSNTSRISDITLGDFWGIEKSIRGFDDGKGVSVCIINTNKGIEIFNEIKNNFDIIESKIENCLQQNLKEPTPKNKDTEEFWNYYEKYDFKKAIKKYAKIPAKIRIKNYIYKILGKIKILDYIKGNKK